MRMNAVAALP